MGFEYTPKERGDIKWRKLPACVSRIASWKHAPRQHTVNRCSCVAAFAAALGVLSLVAGSELNHLMAATPDRLGVIEAPLVTGNPTAAPPTAKPPATESPDTDETPAEPYLPPESLIPEHDAAPLDDQNLSPARSSVDNEALQKNADWQPLDAAAMSQLLRRSLDTIGAPPEQIGRSAQQFLTEMQQDDSEPLTAWVVAIALQINAVNEMLTRAQDRLLELPPRLDPSGPDYASMESLPPEIRAALRTWIGRELVRARYYDEALPIFAEVDPAISPDAVSLLFYRAVCYHSLLKTKEALADLRTLLQHKDDIPVRYSRIAEMMIADIEPLKEDSLDEISRLMTDVTRRLDLGRADEPTQQREQEVIDKLTKLIDKVEKQQQQQQQQQQGGQQGGSPKSGQSQPMQDSQIAGANGQGDVDRKNTDDKNSWGNLPPAERQESLQQISRDLPTHYREAIEAYFRKLATQQNP